MALVVTYGTHLLIQYVKAMCVGVMSQFYFHKEVWWMDGQTDICDSGSNKCHLRGSGMSLECLGGLSIV